MGSPLTDLPPEAYQDDPWPQVLPWLALYPPGSLRELADLSPAPDWWLTESPAVTTMVVDHFELCTALARVLIARHADTPLAQSLPTLPPQLPVSALPAGSRARTTFQRLDVHTMRDLIDVTVKDMFDTRGTGPGTVEEVVTALIAAAVTVRGDGSRTDGADQPGGPRSDRPAAQMQLLEDVTRVAGWRHIRKLSDKPLFALTVEATAPEEIQEAVQRINSLTAIDVLPPVPQADPVEELTALVSRLDVHQRTLLHERFLAQQPKDHADIGADLAVPASRVKHIEEQLHDRLARTFHFGTAVGNLIASIRVEIQPVAALDRLIRLHPELAMLVPELDVPLWHVLDRLDDYFEVTDGWAAAPHTGAAREYTRTWLEDSADPYGTASIDDLTSRSPMPRPELLAWLQWCGYPVVSGHVFTRTATVGDFAAGLLAVTGAPLAVDAIISHLQRDLDARAVQDALNSDGRLHEVAPSTWALVDPEQPPDTEIHKRIASYVDVTDSVDLHDLIGWLSSEFDVTASSIPEAVDVAGYEIVQGRVQRRVSAPHLRKSPAETRRLFQYAGGWRLRTTVTRDQLRGAGFPVPVAVPAIIGCAEGQTVELESRLGTQTIRWTGTQPMSGSIKRFLDDLSAVEGQPIFLEFSHDGGFDVATQPDVGDTDTALTRALVLTGAAPTINEDDAISLLATATGLPANAKPRQVLSAYQQRGDEDISCELESLWTRRARALPSNPIRDDNDNDNDGEGPATSAVKPAFGGGTDVTTTDSEDRPADWIPVPEGYRSVGWVRVAEAQAAVEAYRRHKDIPVLKEGTIVGWARYDPNNSGKGRLLDAEVQLVRVSRHRERTVCWIAEYEAAAIISADTRGRPVMLSPPGKNWSGRVEYYPPSSAPAAQFRSTTRLLRVRHVDQTEPNEEEA